MNGLKASLAEFEAMLATSLAKPICRFGCPRH
jgi:hypothetical protein